jgi:hypothetical protein
MDQKFEEGRIKTTKDIAKSMFKEGLDIKLITKITNLSAIEIIST